MKTITWAANLRGNRIANLPKGKSINMTNGALVAQKIVSNIIFLPNVDGRQPSLEESWMPAAIRMGGGWRTAHV